MKKIKLLIFLFMISLVAWVLYTGAEKSHDNHEGHTHPESGTSSKENIKDDHPAHPEQEKHPEEEEHHEGDKHADEHDSKKEGHNEEENSHEKEHGDDEEMSGSVGPGKAVEEAHEEKGIRLSAKALKRLGIKTIAVPQSPSAYPASSLVKYQEETGVYRFQQGWFKLIPLDSPSFQRGDEIVISGAALLRAAELDAFGGTEEEH